MKSLNKTLTNIRRTPYQAIAAILVLTITFFVGITISFLTVGIYQALAYFESAPQVLIFFDNEVTEEGIQVLKQSLQDTPQVTKVKYVPQEEALQIYQELNQNDPLLLELVTADILPASLEVSTTNLGALKVVAAQAAEAPGVDEVVLRNDVVDLLNKWLQGIKLAGTAFISIMTLTSLIIIGIVVGMKIAGKNYEITVLQLIGASRWYIQGPFLLEGAIYGLISSLIAFLLSFTLLLYSTPVILEFSGEVPLIPNSPMMLGLIFFFSTTLGVSIGTIGSWIAVKRFLNK